MLDNPVIKFSCPSCQIRLTVPVELGGVTGPCPRCSESITAPKPQVQERTTIAPVQALPAHQRQPQTATPEPFSKPESQAEIPTYTPTRTSWVSALIPLSLLALTIGAIYSILSIMGVFGSPQQTFPTREKSTSSGTSEPNVTPPRISPPVVKLPEEEVTIEDPEINPVNRTPLPDQMSADQKARLILDAQETLAAFFQAENFDQKEPFIATNSRSDEELRLSCLGSELPSHTSPVLEKTRLREVGFEAFFTVKFDDPAQTGKKRSITIQTVSKHDAEKPRILVDPFIDLFENKASQFAKQPSSSLQTLSCIFEYSSYSFDDIPSSDTMAKVSLFASLAPAEAPIATAYLKRTSEAFSEIRKLGKPDEQMTAILTLGWDLETDPQRPYLKVLGLESSSWVSE